MMGFKAYGSKQVFANGASLSEQWWDLKEFPDVVFELGYRSLSEQWWDLKILAAGECMSSFPVLANNDGI